MEYKRVIQEFPNGTNINLIPILTPEEEEKRHQRLNDAAVRLLLAQEKKDKQVKRNWMRSAEENQFMDLERVNPRNTRKNRKKQLMIMIA